MATIICQHCGKVKEVRGTSGDTSPLPEALAVKEWCQCAKIPDWWSFTFSPPEILTQKDAEIARLTAELAQARAERDAEQKRRVFAEEGEENLRFLKKLWENESGFYLRKSHDRYLTIERQRRTIRALVVAGRGMNKRIVRDHMAKCPHEVYYKVDRNFVRNQIKHSMADKERRWFDNRELFERAERGQQAGE